jgi:hypothetical protein
MKKVGNCDYAHPMRNCFMHPKDLGFFFFWGLGCWSLVLPDVFSPTSNNVYIRLPIDTPTMNPL